MICNLQSLTQTLQARCVLEFRIFLKFYFRKVIQCTYSPGILGRTLSSSHVFVCFFFLTIRHWILFYFIWPCQHSMWDLSSPTRDRTRAPCSGSAESWPLDHQGSPHVLFWCQKNMWNAYIIILNGISKDYPWSMLVQVTFYHQWVHVRSGLLPNKFWKPFIFQIFWFRIVDFGLWVCIIHIPYIRKLWLREFKWLMVQLHNLQIVEQ